MMSRCKRGHKCSGSIPRHLNMALGHEIIEDYCQELDVINNYRCGRYLVMTPYTMRKALFFKIFTPE